MAAQQAQAARDGFDPHPGSCHTFPWHESAGQAPVRAGHGPGAQTHCLLGVRPTATDPAAAPGSPLIEGREVEGRVQRVSPASAERDAVDVAALHGCSAPARPSKQSTQGRRAWQEPAEPEPFNMGSAACTRARLPTARL